MISLQCQMVLQRLDTKVETHIATGRRDSHGRHGVLYYYTYWMLVLWLEYIPASMCTLSFEKSCFSVYLDYEIAAQSDYVRQHSTVCVLKEWAGARVCPHRPVGGKPTTTETNV